MRWLGREHGGAQGGSGQLGRGRDDGGARFQAQDGDEGTWGSTCSDEKGLDVRGLKLEMVAPWQGVLGGRPCRRGQGVVLAHQAREEVAASDVACGGTDPSMGR